MKNTDVAILVRVSSATDRQDYQRQINDLQKLAKRKKWNVVKIIKAKVSATKTRLKARQDIADLYELVEQGSIQKVLVTELTRLGRVAREIREVYEYLNDNGISIFINSMGIDTGSKEPFQKAINNIIVTILAEIAELETVRLSDRIRSGMKKAKADGKHIGRRVGVKNKTSIKDKIKTNSKYKRAAKSLREGLSIRKTAAYAGLATGTVKAIKDVITTP